MLKSVIALSIIVFTFTVFCYPSDAFYAKGCSSSHMTSPVSHHKMVAEDTSAPRNERISAIRCLREYGAEGAQILAAILEHDLGNADAIGYTLSSLGHIRDRSVIIILQNFIKRIDADLASAKSSSVPLKYSGLFYKERAIEILAKLALSAYDEPSGIHPLTPSGRNEDGTVSIVVCGGIAWYRQFESVGIRPRQSDARKIIDYLTEIKNSTPGTQRKESMVKAASEGLELIEYRIALLEEHGPELVRRETDSRKGWKTTLYVKDIAHSIDEFQDILTYRAVYQALADEIEGVLASDSVDSLIKALSDASDDVRRRALVLLGLSRHPNAVPAIYKRLRNDPSLEVRLQAADSLGRLAGEKAVPALEEALENDHAMVHGVIPGLGHAGGAGVPLLIKMLKDEIDNPDGESRVADLIVYSLKNTGDRRAIQPLIDIIKRPADYKTDWPSTQKIAAQVLARFATRKHYDRILYYRRNCAEGISVTPAAHHQVTKQDIKQIVTAVKNAGYDIDELERNFADLDFYDTFIPGELNTEFAAFE